MSEEAAVLFANDAFYNAFTTRDLEALEALWSRDAPVVCVHPGWAPLFGYQDVMQSWANILSAPTSPEIACRDPKTHFLSEETCMVTCYEILGGGALVATNIFVKEGTDWRMVHHQASPANVPPPPAQDPEPRLQ